MEELSLILQDLEQGKISVDNAEQQVLDLFAVSGAKRKCCENCKHQFSSFQKCSGCAPSYIKWQPKQH